MRITATGNVGIGTASPTERLQVSDGNIAITNTDNTARELRLYEPSGSGTNYTAFRAQAQASDITYTLPASLTPTSTVEAGILQTDASGNLSWLTPSALVSGGAWALTGNSITGTEFLGTTNAQPLVIRTDNTERLRVTAAGDVVVQNQATGAPTTVLRVLGGNNGAGATQVVLQAGANQSGVDLLQWRNNSGAPLGFIRPDGSVVLVYDPPARQAFFAVANPSGVPLIGIGPDPSGWGVAVYEPIAPFGQLRAGMGKVGTEWRMGVGDLAAQNGVLLSWATSTTGNEPRIVVADGSLANPVFLVDREGDVTVRGTTVALPNIPSGSTATEVLVWKSPGGEVERRAASGLISGFAWALTGNSGTDPGVNFLGTTDAQPLVIRTNNIERLRVTATGHVLPGADNAYDLGSSSLRWANIYGVNGSLSGSLTVAGTLNVGSGSVLQGNTVIGGAATDEVQFVGRVVTDVLPKTDDAYDLGSATQRWRSGYFGTQVKVGASVSLVAGTPDRLEYGGDGIVRTSGYLAVETGGAERLRVTATGNVLPGADDAYDLGAVDARWANIYGVNGSLSGSLTVAGTLNVGNGAIIVGDLSTSGGTVAFSETATLTNDGSDLTLPSNVAVVEIDDGSTPGDITINPPTTGTQGQLLFIRYSGSRNLTLFGVLPGGGNQTATAQFHAILMYIGGAWRLMSFVD
jgi:cytoskeletal protein CcmA (bactofilin family)